MEVAESLARLAQAGWRPKRSILFASWDAEEFALTSSTEWSEEHAADLREHAVAYLNVDSAVSGARFSAAAVPALNRLITEAAQAIRDPVTHVPVSTAFRDSLSSGTFPPGESRDLVNNRLGGGSDYTVFLNFLGVPVADLSFRGPYGVYHSRYDTHGWVARLADPGFRYHVALVRMWGLLALRLADADVLPIDYGDYAVRIKEFLVEAAANWRDPSALASVERAAGELASSAAELELERRAALDRNDRVAMAAIDGRLIRAERALVDMDGLPGRPWYRHLIFAPQFSYAPETLPALTEAIQAGDAAKVDHAADRLAAAVRRAAAVLRTPSATQASPGPVVQRAP
jgi:N-acetylated-alpha-linked acidic dipeptidase